MNIKWGKKTYTFMIIPDANAKIKRFRLSAHMLYILTILILTSVCLTLAVHIQSLKNAEAKRLIAEELKAVTSAYENTIEDKDRTIETLQLDLLTLSEQAEYIKVKFDELKLLEQQLLHISEVKPGEPVDRPVMIASAGTESSADRDEPLGIGGIMLEAGDEHMEALVADTRKTLSGMNREIGDLIINFTNAKEQMEKALQLMKVTPSIWPTRSTKVTSKFGTRRDPFSRRPAFHAGIDISGRSGDPVYATADGTVISAEYDRSYGYNVVIRHANGLQTRYAHLRKILTKKGQKVQQGEEIGLLGSTGKSTGPHLHYEIIKDGKAIDPMPYLQTARLEER